MTEVGSFGLTKRGRFGLLISFFGDMVKVVGHRWRSMQTPLIRDADLRVSARERYQRALDARSGLQRRVWDMRPAIRIALIAIAVRFVRLLRVLQQFIMHRKRKMSPNPDAERPVDGFSPSHVASCEILGFQH